MATSRGVSSCDLRSLRSLRSLRLYLIFGISRDGIANILVRLKIKQAATSSRHRAALCTTRAVDTFILLILLYVPACVQWYRTKRTAERLRECQHTFVLVLPSRTRTEVKNKCQRLHLVITTTVLSQPGDMQSYTNNLAKGWR